MLSEIELLEEEVAAVLRNLAGGPDGIPGRLLKELANVIAPSLCKLFNQSFSLGVMPAEWKFEPWCNTYGTLAQIQKLWWKKLQPYNKT